LEASSSMAVAQENPVVGHLRDAVACLFTAVPLIAKAVRGAQRNGVAALSAGHTSSRLVDTSHAVRNSLEGALAVLQASGEDELVQVTLQQYEQACAAHTQVDEEIKTEGQYIAELRKGIREIERSIARAAGDQNRLQASSGAERIRALQRRREVAKTTLSELQKESEGLSQRLEESIQQNRELDASMQKLEQEHQCTIKENARAHRALRGDPSLESYRKTKAQERLAADEALARAYAECEAEMARLAKEWAGKQTQFEADLRDLQEEHKTLEVHLQGKQTEAEETLSRQADENGQTVSDAQNTVNSDIQRMEEVRQQKVLALRSEVARSRQMVQEASIGVQKRMEIQANEVRLAYRYKKKIEEARCKDEISAERQSVEAAKKEREEMERKAARVRENYRAHAVKSGTYVKSMDPQRRQKLMQLWG